LTERISAATVDSVTTWTKVQLDRRPAVDTVFSQMARDASLLAVVDDDADVRVALTRLVSSAGFTVETYASGAEFLDSIRDHKPDCVVLDLHMPDLSGFDVQDALADAHAAIPVVVMTGHDTPESRARALQLGAHAYLCKPVDDNALLAAISTAIGGIAAEEKPA
jgi:FixJ family two-component response regulator